MGTISINGETLHYLDNGSRHIDEVFPSLITRVEPDDELVLAMFRRTGILPDITASNASDGIQALLVEYLRYNTQRLIMFCKMYNVIRSKVALECPGDAVALAVRLTLQCLEYPVEKLEDLKTSDECDLVIPELRYENDTLLYFCLVKWSCAELSYHYIF